MLLELNNISKTYQSGANTVLAVDDVSLEIDAGEFVAVRGPSGCGKSTLLLVAGALLSPDAGVVAIDGQDPYALAPDERARFRGRTIGFVFQQFHLVPYLSVVDNILAPAMVTGLKDASVRAQELTERFSLGHRVNHVPSQLSTGERQRTALARALLNQPKLLLADEPTGNLDSENGQVVLEYLRQFASEGGAVLLVTHDDAAVAAADRAIDILDGRLTAPV